jgi:uncharacterized protein YdhG (YjbR/CyaY superfamily)
VTTPFTTIDDYIGSLPEEVRGVLERVRQTVRHAAPAAGESISYNMPTFTLDGGARIHVAAWKHHIGLYPVPTADEALERELAPYRAARSTVRFPLRAPIPYELIERLVTFRAARRPDGGEGTPC